MIDVLAEKAEARMLTDCQKINIKSSYMREDIQAIQQFYISCACW